jgi:hypothetical protein
MRSIEFYWLMEKLSGRAVANDFAWNLASGVKNGGMILQQGEKVHVIHRRHFEKDHHRHFIGTVESYDCGVARVTGHVYTVDPVKFSYVRRPEMRTRIISIVSGDLLVNVLPPQVALEKITYKQEKSAVRVTDGSEWHLDISEFTWM